VPSLFIDGTNLLGSRPDGWWRRRAAATAELLERLAAARPTGEEWLVVFDGRPGPDHLDVPGIEVVFAPGGPDAADREILRRLSARDGCGRGATVVTSDQALAEGVRRLGAEVVGAGRFRAWLERSADPDNPTVGRTSDTAGPPVAAGGHDEASAPDEAGAGDEETVADWQRAVAETRGFLPPNEGWALHEAVRRAARRTSGAIVEIGAYCGLSTLYLAAAARAAGRLLFSVDHHRGSEELQAGWPDHDPSVVDPESGRIDTLPHWRRNVARAGLEDTAVAIVGDATRVAAYWRSPIALLFIDGGHGQEPAWADYRAWSPWISPGGTLAIHDVFPDPADGGRPPYEIHEAALASGLFVTEAAVGSLRLLERLHATDPRQRPPRGPHPRRTVGEVEDPARDERGT